MAVAPQRAARRRGGGAARTAHAIICSAWYCEGEQIQTACTSGLLITSIASEVYASSLYFSAAA